MENEYTYADAKRQSLNSLAIYVGFREGTYKLPITEEDFNQKIVRNLEGFIASKIYPMIEKIYGLNENYDSNIDQTFTDLENSGIINLRSPIVNYKFDKNILAEENFTKYCGHVTIAVDKLAKYFDRLDFYNKSLSKENFE